MDEYVRYALLADGIQSEQLLTEIGLLEKAAYDVVVRTSAETGFGGSLPAVVVGESVGGLCADFPGSGMSGGKRAEKGNEVGDLDVV
jgi:hypothetical protein